MVSLGNVQQSVVLAKKNITMISRVKKVYCVNFYAQTVADQGYVLQGKKYRKHHLVKTVLT